MQRGGSSHSNENQVASRRPSVALAERNQGATLPVRLLRDTPGAARADHVEDGFQMKVDAHGFTPEELVVKVDGRSLTVTGHQELEASGPDGAGYRMARKVHREVRLPPEVDPASMSCCLTPSGQLCFRGQCPSLPSPEAQIGPAPRLRGQGSKKGPNPA
ncbi:heat shock protein beta-9 [Choloepus didactylus]|uniref:heat shock protein beta-9 n=1 Tax=Choloepus didactylus TaxID=27675 RepID=UPI00189F83EC|nr:heat shock protein beta-9 [Choloepus didactylus]